MPQGHKLIRLNVSHKYMNFETISQCMFDGVECWLCILVLCHDLDCVLANLDRGLWTGVYVPS